ncbi:hypothetical protein BDR26DRAFT_898719 [Obelidium mucronatum]|nr:hypothetical protein BDR26DRAFT_898719 [Obelidium mucronatum]
MSFKESRLKRHPFVLIQGNKISGTSLQLREYAQEQPPHAAPLGASQSHRSAAAPQRLNTAIDPSVALDQPLSLVDLDVKELDRAIARKLQHRIVYKPPTDEKRRSLIELHDSTVAAAMLGRKKRALQHDAAATDDAREYQLLAEAEQFYSGRSLIERKQLYTNTCTSRNAKEHASLPPAPPSTAPTAPKASKNIPSLFTDDEVFHVGGAVEPWAEAEKDAFNEFHVQLHNTKLTNFLFPSTFGGGGGNGMTPSWESRQPGNHTLVGTVAAAMPTTPTIAMLPVTATTIVIVVLGIKTVALVENSQKRESLVQLVTPSLE